MSLAGLPRLSDKSLGWSRIDGPLGIAAFVEFCLWGLYLQFSAMINHDIAWCLHSVAAFF